MLNTGDEVLEALAEGEFESVIGTAEGDCVEFKEQSYGLEEPRHKFELAKDVTAMANHRGGLIIIGYSTEVDPSTEVERAAAIRPIPRERFPISRIRTIVREFSYPQISVQCQWWPTVPDGATGIATILVDPLDERLRMAVVRVGDVEDGRRPTDRAIGVFRREGADNHHVPASLIQEWIRLGRGRPTGEPRPGMLLHGAQDGQQPERQLAEDSSETAPRTPYLWLQAGPLEAMTVRWLLDGDQSVIRDRFLSPPQLRSTGFNYDFQGDLEPLPGGGLRKLVAGRISLSVLPSGLTTAVVGYDYLGWGMDSDTRNPPLPPGTINQLAMAELSHEFCRYYLLTVVPEEHVRHAVAIGLVEDSDEGEARAHLYPGPLSDWYAFRSPKTLSGGRRAATVNVTWTNGDPGACAAALLRGLYLEFGLRGDDVPYVRGNRLEPSAFASRG